MAGSKWLEIEKMVQVLERSISNDSIVEHNVRLPDLNSSIRRLRQCDIIVWSGEVPRRTLTIVEVQCRSKRLDINTFDGFVQKMRDVGAQHLICVSTKGFSKSISEKAERMGGTVRLISLVNYAIDRVPFNFIKFSIEDTRLIYDFKTPPKIHYRIESDLPKSLQFEIHDTKYIISDNPLLELTLDQLLTKYFKKNNMVIDGCNHLRLPEEGTELFMIVNHQRLQLIEFEWDIYPTIKINQPEVFVYSYEQENFGPLAWIIRASSTIEGMTISLQVPVMFGEDGNFNFMIEDMVINRNESATS